MHPLKLKIQLQNLPHPVTRTVLVPEDINLWQFHLVIQDALGWENAHLFAFKDKQWENTISVELPDGTGFNNGFSFGRPPVEKYEPQKVGLKKLLLEGNEGKPFLYWYDFGDDWWHKISFQNVSKKDLEQYEGFPLCVKAEGACPPEDIGGPWGYESFLEAVDNPRHPEYGHYREWLGLKPREKYSLEAPPTEAINNRLVRVFRSKAWKNKNPSFF